MRALHLLHQLLLAYGTVYTATLPYALGILTMLWCAVLFAMVAFVLVTTLWSLARLARRLLASSGRSRMTPYANPVREGAP